MKMKKKIGVDLEETPTGLDIYQGKTRSWLTNVPYGRKKYEEQELQLGVCINGWLHVTNRSGTAWETQCSCSEGYMRCLDPLWRKWVISSVLRVTRIYIYFLMQKRKINN
jgi:hypothetical protein